jgi:beta-N-acetylhexosaminidase
MSEITSGSFLMYTLQAPYLTVLDKKLLASLQPCSIKITPQTILPGVPYEDWFSGLKALYQEVNSVLKNPPLFVAAPFVCGPEKFPAPFTSFPRPFLYRKKARRIANAVACELSSLGVNLLLAPCSDIYGTTTIAEVREKTFGGTGDIVSRFAYQFRRGLYDLRMMGCASHFPGDGYTTEGTSGQLLNIRTEAEIRADELLPFKALIDTGIEAIMMSHALFPALDPELPACHSSDIVGELLRRELGFEGLVIGADLQNVSVQAGCSLAEALVRGVAAGCNLFVISPDAAFSEQIDELESNFQSLIEPYRELALKRFARTSAIAYMHRQPKPQKLERSVFQQHGTLAYEAEFNVSSS